MTISDNIFYISKYF